MIFLREIYCGAAHSIPVRKYKFFFSHTKWVFSHLFSDPNPMENQQQQVVSFQDLTDATAGKLFKTRADLLDYVKDFCKEKGIVLVTKTGALKRIVLKCDLGGEYIA
jgi:hypothetical protein